LLKFAACAVLASVALCAGAQTPSPATLWYEAGHVELMVTDAPRGLAASWQFDRADNGDVRIIKEERRGASMASGTLLSVCGDQALLFKDIVPARQGELQELNEPVLHLQLVLRLLARALPQGPLALAEPVSIDIGDDENPLRVRKDFRTHMEFGVPWHARGMVSGGSAGEARFDFNFDYANGAAGKGRFGLKLAGRWQRQSSVRAFADALPLAGWRVHRVDTVAETIGGNTMLASVAMPAPLQFATLGELRQRIEQRWDSGPHARQQFECTR
jgi:hypothetical protein